MIGDDVYRDLFAKRWSLKAVRAELCDSPMLRMGDAVSSHARTA